jgi:hypothetical protein
LTIATRWCGVLILPVSGWYHIAPNVCSDMLAILDCELHDQLARAVYTMTLFRDQCLSCSQDVAISVDASQLAVEQDVEGLLRIS